MRSLNCAILLSHGTQTVDMFYCYVCLVFTRDMHEQLVTFAQAASCCSSIPPMATVATANTHIQHTFTFPRFISFPESISGPSNNSLLVYHTHTDLSTCQKSISHRAVYVLIHHNNRGSDAPD